MKKPPTDLEILEEIYERYFATYVGYSRETATRGSKVYVPIDIKTIAKHFKTDEDIIFGRLYYHLEPKYGFTQDNDSKVHFFALSVGIDTHCIQFPLLASLIASLREERSKHLIATWLSAAALVVSVISIAISIFASTP